MMFKRKSDKSRDSCYCCCFCCHCPSLSSVGRVLAIALTTASAVALAELLVSSGALVQVLRWKAEGMSRADDIATGRGATSSRPFQQMSPTSSKAWPAATATVEQQLDESSASEKSTTQLSAEPAAKEQMPLLSTAKNMEKTTVSLTDEWLDDCVRNFPNEEIVVRTPVY